MNPRAEAAALALKRKLDEQPKVFRLYDLTDALIAIDEQLHESGGELLPETEALLEDMQGRFDAKVDAICTLRQNYIRAAEALEAEEDRLRKRRFAAERAGESLREYLHNNLLKLGEDRVKTSRFTVYVQASPDSVVWTKDVAELPEDYARVRIEPDIQKAKAALALGNLPEGFEIQRNTHLRIR